MPQSRKQNSATFTQPETIGLFALAKTPSQRYRLTRRGKLKRLAQIAQIVNQFDIVRGLTPIKMRLMFEALGPTFVKVGQILSMRSEILPQSFCDELSKLRADADPMPYGTVLQVLEDEYGRPVDEIFEHIDATPLGSASLAQVHRAKLSTGDGRGRQSTAAGRRNHGTGCVHHAPLHESPPKPCAARKWSISPAWSRNCGSTFESETDFLIEARNLAEFKRFANATTTSMDCPKPYPELCTEHVVVMDYASRAFPSRIPTNLSKRATI